MIKNCPIGPALPADIPVRHNDTVVNRGNRGFLRQVKKMVSDQMFIPRGNNGDKFFSDDLIAGFLEIPAICLVNKYVGNIGKKPADKFSLVFYDVPVAYFTIQ